jgi:ABC-2 type transport system ATP-binding protein
MDEPFTGLDPVNVALLREAFLELRDRGKTLIFSTHQMELVEEMCEAVAIVDRGRVVVGGPLGEVRRAAGRRLVRL